MRIVNIDREQVIQGISVRTNNANEMSSNAGEIPRLYQNFDQKITLDYAGGARAYGVYYNYESDASGDFSVLAGADEIKASDVDLEEVELPSGKYLVFEGRGEMPQLVIDLWGEVWRYFSEESSVEKRLYTVDFEHYLNQDEVAIYIAIK